jgi:hypothetical protein
MKNMPSNIHFFLDRTTPTHPTHHHLVVCNSHHATEANQSVSSPNDGTFQASERAEQCSQRHIEQSEAWQCPLWVNNRHSAMSAPRLLCPDKRTLIYGIEKSASCQKLMQCGTRRLPLLVHCCRSNTRYGQDRHYLHGFAREDCEVRMVFEKLRGGLV